MDRPIIFSAPMVRALLDGRKTQTRRVLKPQPTRPGVFQGILTDNNIALFNPVSGALIRDCEQIRLPYAPGDRLWVREAVRAEELSRPPKKRAATAKERRILERTHVVVQDDLDGADGVRYIADDEWRRIQNTSAAGNAWSELYHYRGCGKDGIGNPVPSIHMPRWASRLTLHVSEVRVQRLQEISEADVYAEGAMSHPTGPRLGSEVTALQNARNAFARLWNSLHGEGAWDANPWVAAISFEVEKANIDQAKAE